MTIKKEELEVAGEKVVLDPEHLKFNETTLNEYIIKEGAYYDNFGGYLARAEKVLQYREMELEETFSDLFAMNKDAGGSDRLAEARAKSDSTFVSKKKQVLECKYLVTRLKNHLKAWDKNHDNAQSLGHMLRKGMDKLNAEIRTGLNGTYGDHTSGEDVHNKYDEVDSIVKSIDESEL